MFPKDCAELIKALGSFDYTSANKHLIRITKAYPTVGSVCSRVIQCESVYSSMQFLKPRMFRREDHLYQLYNDIALDVEREMMMIHRDTSASIFGPALEHQRTSGTTGLRHGVSGHSSPVMNHSDPAQPSLHQFMSNSQGNNGAGISGSFNHGNPKNMDTASINNISPTYSHLQYSGNYSEREDQAIADQIVLYTIIQELCFVRMALTSIYRLLSSSTVEIITEEILPEVEQAHNRYITEAIEIQNCVLGIGIEYEISSLKHGLLLHAATSEYDIQKSAINLHLARVALSEWRQLSSEQEYVDKSYNRPEETSWRYNIFSSGEDKSKSSASKGKFSLLPNHNQWINRWIASEKSKMTMYYMNTLMEKEQAMGGDERTLWANTEPDLHGMIRAFRKKAGAQSISLVYEITQQVRFSQSGFVSANSSYEAPTGLNSFPCIYSYPPDPPKDHWPNIISIIQGSVNILRQFRSQYFYDRKIGCTYYVARVDQHVSIVIIYLDKHPQPDTGAMDFLQLLASKLRHTEALTAMRVE
ncbi:hypothetical protein BGZ76_006760 [Entomortierella beljakovae]|nr:hypothetical protein BGZ76_006760 [Entomortierella beljakovae]